VIGFESLKETWVGMTMGCPGALGFISCSKTRAKTSFLLRPVLFYISHWSQRELFTDLLLTCVIVSCLYLNYDFRSSDVSSSHLWLLLYLACTGCSWCTLRSNRCHEPSCSHKSNIFGSPVCVWPRARAEEVGQERTADVWAGRETVI